MAQIGAENEYKTVAVDSHNDRFLRICRQFMEHHLIAPPLWLVAPFVLLLLLIATGPVFFGHFWEKNYKWIAPVLGLLPLGYYLLVLHDHHTPIHTFAEYISFIALLASLFFASGGILIQVNKQGKPWVNIAFLWVGAIMANIIGTTGASMLLIRPFMRLNRDRMQPYLVVFFIFVVSNVAGSLTPIGDPPLFLGMLKGVPPLWTLTHLFPHWLLALTLLSAIFYWLDSRNSTDRDRLENIEAGDFTIEFSGHAEREIDTLGGRTYFRNAIHVVGGKSFFWLLLIIASVPLDPNVIDGIPFISFEGSKISFIRELIQFTAAFLSYRFANKEAHKGNEFNSHPIQEVAFLFVGIFFAMMPALQLIGHFAGSPAGQQFFTLNSFYWLTGGLSSVLDNAPTYASFLAAACGKFGMDVTSPEAVAAFAFGAETAQYLAAISAAAVFFGAMTYIGNGPNFMVKAIAEQRGLQMPTFGGYIVYSAKYLLPVLIIVWLIFFVI